MVGPPRPGRTVVYTGDTRPSQRVRGGGAGADLLIHEATFAQDEEDRAGPPATPRRREAARRSPRSAGVRRLVLTHFSPATPTTRAPWSARPGASSPRPTPRSTGW